jgi:cold shock CspA family protein
VVRIFPKDGYGFLATADGREIFFHQRSVLRGGFGRLRVGSAVRFVEEAGEEGPQASTVVQVRVRRGAQADVGGATA